MDHALPFRPLLALAALLLPTAAGAQIATSDQRILPRPVTPPEAYEAALAAGTREPSGRPGDRYWQQRVSYRIQAALDVSTGRITGSEAVTYVNNSPDSLREIMLHLDQNVYAAGVTRNRSVPITGGVSLSRVEVAGVPVETRFHRAGSYYEQPTLLVVPLPVTLLPGDSTTIELDWSHTVAPAPTYRGANLNGEVFAVSHWYPRAAVYDDVYGWDATPYLGDGEFYLEYGDFDVRLTLPAGWMVAATGELANAREVLTEPVRRRLDAASRSDTVVHVVQEEQRGAGRATLGTPGSSIVWHLTAQQVRDFAWSTSAGYVWDAVRAADGTLVHTFYRPQFPNWRAAWQYARHAVEDLTRELGPYPYPQVTAAEGPIGGMEYPMLVFIGSRPGPRGLAGVIIHEVAHEWFPMVVGSMEAKHAWMDEGFVSYWDELVARQFWGEEPPMWGDTRRYLMVAGTEREVPLMRHTDLVSPYGERGLAAYTKPAVALGALRSVLGDSTFRAAFRDYYEAWAFKHPQPWDFFATMERHAGTDLDWFWRPLFFETDVLDHGVDGVEIAGDSSVIRVRDHGAVVLPAPIEITLRSGSTRREHVGWREWLAAGRSVALSVPGHVIRVELDPDHLYPDVDRTNNTWTGTGANRNRP